MPSQKRQTNIVELYGFGTEFRHTLKGGKGQRLGEFSIVPQRTFLK